MSGEPEKPNWAHEFGILPPADLDFLVSHGHGWSVGTSRSSTPEFMRRLSAAATSYFLQLRSIDYTYKQYVDQDLFESRPATLGDNISDFLKGCARILDKELFKLHRENPSFGQVGAELTLFRFPDTLDVARTLSDRGRLLEVLAILRLSVEQISWSAVAFHLAESNDVRHLRAQSSITKFKAAYSTIGKIYGFLSQYSHWQFDVHPEFFG
ncbi:MAG: hypothetical protein WB697_09710, partial [Stellaceae bacterium]